MSFFTSLRNCVKERDLHKGSIIHADVARRGLLEKDVYVGSTLVSMYAKCGALAKAREVFYELPVRNVVSWNALIAGFAQHGQSKEAIDYFDKMKCEGCGLVPDAVTYACIFKACGNMGAIDKGQEIHGDISQDPLLVKDTVVGTALVDMYAKCHMLPKAREVFDELPGQDPVLWNALITGYTHHGQGEKALECAESMQLGGLFPNTITIVSTLKACGSVGAFKKGKEVHAKVLADGSLSKDIAVANALLDMYSKCNLPLEAQEFFDDLSVRNVVSWNTLIAGYVQNGYYEEALDRFESMQQDCVLPDVFTMSCILNACGSLAALDKGQEVHNYITNNGLMKKDEVVTNSLIDMYTKCGALSKAQEVLDTLSSLGVVSWNALISGYAQHGHVEEALYCLKRMQHQGPPPDEITFACVLKACGSMDRMKKGQEIHAQICSDGLLDNDVMVGTALVDMYATLSMLAEAQFVFEDMEVQSIVSWNAMIAGYAQHGHGEEALHYFDMMQLAGFSPVSVTYACALKACSDLAAAEKGKEIHCQIRRGGLLRQDIIVSNALVDMYANCGLLGKAQEVFDDLLRRDVISWNVLVAGYAQHLHCEKALECFVRMQCEGLCPDGVTLSSLLKACGNIEALDKGQEIHVRVKAGSLEQDMVVTHALLGMYAKCGDLLEARECFDRLHDRNVVVWNTLIAGYAQNGNGEEAWDSFQQMQQEGLSPDSITFADVLKACGSIRAEEKGCLVHAQIAKVHQIDIVAGISLLDMYVKCGLLGEAQQVFDELSVWDIIGWNVLLGGYVQHACVDGAFTCFERMQSKGITPDAFTYLCILKACASCRDAFKGQEMHVEIVKDGLLQEDDIVGTALVDMYSKCGMLEEAQDVFSELSARDSVSWNALITLHAVHAHAEEALVCFRRMQQEGFLPDMVTFGHILRVCGNTGAANYGQEIHGDVVQKGLLEKDAVIIGHDLVDLYVNCGMLAEAQSVFGKFLVKDVVSWNGLIAGFAKLGKVEAVFDLVNTMVGEGIEPDSVTFTFLFYTCSHNGLVEEGQLCFETLCISGCLIPTVDHYACMVDLYCRTGQFDEAVVIVEEMPTSANLVVWYILLSAFQKWGAANLGQWAFNHAAELDA